MYEKRGRKNDHDSWDAVQLNGEDEEGFGLLTIVSKFLKLAYYQKRFALNNYKYFHR